MYGTEDTHLLPGTSDVRPEMAPQVPLRQQQGGGRASLQAGPVHTAAAAAALEQVSGGRSCQPRPLRPQPTGRGRAPPTRLWGRIETGPRDNRTRGLESALTW